jgi:hypothetical protein
MKEIILKPLENHLEQYSLADEHFQQKEAFIPSLELMFQHIR